MRPELRRFSFLFVVTLLLARGAAVRADEPVPDVDPKKVIEEFDIGGGVDESRDVADDYCDIVFAFIPANLRFALDWVFSALTPDSGILLPVEVNGNKYPFILDTGTSRNMFDVSLPLGKPIPEADSPTHDPSFAVKYFKAPRATLGRFYLKTADAVPAIDLAQIRDGILDDVYGIIGMEFLKGQVVRIDRDRWKVWFLKSPGPDAGRPVQLLWHPKRNSYPWVVAEIPGWGPELFLVDTGDLSYGVALRKELFAALEGHGILTPRAEAKKLGLTGKVSRVRTGWLCEFRTGDFIERQVAVDESPNPFSALGLHFLDRFVVTFDFPHHTMYLSPSKCGEETRKRAGQKSAAAAVRNGQIRKVAWQPPANGALYRERGFAYSCLQRFDKAIADYDEAIRLDPNDANAYFYRAYALAAKREYDRAITDDTRAIELDPENPGYYYERADVYRRCEKYEPALGRF